jgi:peptidoglycan L-alanyl-D-glutamate endopeptidase CwlK
MTFKLSARSKSMLIGVHPDLVRVVEQAILITMVDFSVVCGVRSLAAQRKLFTAGKSKTMHSKHLTGHAVDLAPWVGKTINWADGPHWHQLSTAVKEAATMCGVEVQWGGDWQTFIDKPHWQIQGD